MKVAIVAWNGAALLPACLESVLAQRPCPEVLVVDNASADDSRAVAQSYAPRFAAQGGALRVLAREVNGGFTIGANDALRDAAATVGEHVAVLLLNQDATLEPNCLVALEAAFARDPKVGVAGCKLLYPDRETLQHAGGFLDGRTLEGRHFGHREKDVGQYDLEREVEFVTGAALALRLACLRELGGFDEVFAPGYYEDVALCGRARAAGWKVLYVPTARACHLESASFTDRMERFTLSRRNRLLNALPALLDPRVAAQLLDAERAALPTAPLELVRALGRASLELLAGFDAFAAARIPAGADRAKVADLLLALRELATAEVRRRRRGPLVRGAAAFTPGGG